MRPRARPAFPAFPALAALLCLLASPARAAGPAVGERAPEFTLTSSSGGPVTLSELLREHDGVVLAWFPRAFTPGCTAELRSLRANDASLAAFDVPVFMVSMDPVEKSRAFAEAESAPFPLLSDPDGRVARAYGVAGPESAVASRRTFYIGADGIVKRIDTSVDTASHGADVARALAELGFPKRAAP